MDWLNSELCALSAIKTSDTAMASIKSQEGVEVKGIIGWHRHRVALLTEAVTHPERVLKVTDLPQAFYRWESSLKEFQRGRPAELDDDVKTNAMRHMMPKEILDAVDLQPQYRTLSEIRDYTLQQARQRADVFVGDVCHSTENVGTVTPRVSTTTNTPTATKTTTPVPADVSQMSSNVSKTETEEPESESYQCEQDQACDGDEVYAVKGRGTGGFKGTCFKCGRETGRKEKVVQWERMVQRTTVTSWSNVGQFLVQFTVARENVRS